MSQKLPIASDQADDEISALIRTLHDTQQRLMLLAGGQVDGVMHPDGQFYLLHEAQEKLRQDEVAQRAAAAMQTTILNALPAHVALIDANGVILSVNDAWREFAEANGLRQSDASVGLNYFQVCRGATGEGAAEAQAAAEGIQQVLQGQLREFSLEYPCATPLRAHWFRLIVTPLRDDVRAGAVVMHLDITARKLAEMALQESESRFRGTFEQVAVGMAHVSLDGKFLRVNDKLCTITGYSREELLEKTFMELTLPEDVAAGVAGRDALLAGNLVTFAAEKRHRRKNGEVFWLRNVTNLERTSSGEPKYFISVIEDITERRKDREHIAEQAALIDQARDAIFVRDLCGRIVSWNKGAERIFGWSAQEAIGSSTPDLLKTNPAKLAAIEEAVFETGEWIGEVEKVTKAKLPVVVDCRWSLLRNAENRPKGFLQIETDVTAQKKTELQFLRAQRMESVGTLAGGIAHDLNNVLGPILMAIELLKMKLPDIESHKIIGLIEASAQRGADLVGQVLSFARGFDGKRVEIHLSHLISEIVKIANETFLKHIEIIHACPQNLWPVIGDPTQLHQVLLNLCVNARDAMPNGGRLTISAENLELDASYAAMELDSKPGPYVLVHVEDTGTGIPRDIVEKIFDPFFTTKDVGKGTGLGLSTSLAIVKSHGGFLRVYSEVGRGTTFNIYLPAQSQPSAAATAAAKAEMPRGNGELIMVIDDEDSVRQITQQTLEAFGYRAITANDGPHAVSIFARRSAEIAVVITDMMMPDMDGVTTIQVLQKINPDIRIIAASGLALNEHVARATSLGVKQFLPKPYTAQKLLSALHDVLAGN